MFLLDILVSCLYLCIDQNQEYCSLLQVNTHKYTLILYNNPGALLGKETTQTQVFLLVNFSR